MILVVRTTRKLQMTL